MSTRFGSRPATARDYLVYGVLLAAVAVWNWMVNAAELGPDGETVRFLGSLTIIAVWSGARALVRRWKRKARR